MCFLDLQGAPLKKRGTPCRMHNSFWNDEGRKDIGRKTNNSVNEILSHVLSPFVLGLFLKAAKLLKRS